MAKQASILKVEGTIEDLTFYKSKDGYVVRKKGGVSKDQIAKDPAFARTRENGIEFGHIAKMGKLLRRTVVDLLNEAKERTVTRRLTQVMGRIKNEDTVSVRGQRQVAIGLSTPQGKAWLKGFDFNADAPLGTVLRSDFTLDTATGEIVILDLIPIKKLDIPEGATHVSFTAGFVNLDFSNGDKDVQISPSVTVPINLTASNVTLTPPAPAIGTGNALYLLLVGFYQEMNGQQYPLNNGAHNALSMIEVL